MLILGLLLMLLGLFMIYGPVYFNKKYFYEDEE